MTIDNSETSQLIPIREVSKLTGVNAVTLRAWERRYGLIKPHRTVKGHRLYSYNHIKQINQIVNWINRGVAVSKIKGLLEKQDATSSVNEEVLHVKSTTNEQWLNFQQQILTAVRDFAEQKLDDICNQILAIYPIDSVGNSVFIPILHILENAPKSELGSQSEKIFYIQYLRNKLSMKLYHANKQSTGKKALFIAPPSEQSEVHLFFPALLAVNYNYQTLLFGPDFPFEELNYISAKLKIDAIIIVANNAITSLLQKEVPSILKHTSVPLGVTGEASIIHAQQLDELNIKHTSTFTHPFLDQLILE